MQQSAAGQFICFKLICELSSIASLTSIRGMTDNIDTAFGSRDMSECWGVIDVLHVIAGKVDIRRGVPSDIHFGVVFEFGQVRQV